METKDHARTLRYRTDIHCGSCVQRLQRALDDIPGRPRLDADLRTPDRWVEIHGDITDAQARAAIAKAGLHVLDDGAAPQKAHQEGPARDASAPPGFWSERPLWKRAAFNTFSCLVGCSIGDFAMIIFLQAYYPATPMAVRMVLAIIAGLATSVMLETVVMRYREQLPWARAFRVAVSMSFISMVAMEIAMNTTDFMITGGGLALSDPRYWLAFIPAALAGFLVPLPYNYHQLKKHGRACH